MDDKSVLALVVKYYRCELYKKAVLFWKRINVNEINRSLTTLYALQSMISESFSFMDYSGFPTIIKAPQ